MRELGDLQDAVVPRFLPGEPIEIVVRRDIPADDAVTVLGLLYAALDDDHTTVEHAGVALAGVALAGRFDGEPVRVLLATSDRHALEFLPDITQATALDVVTRFRSLTLVRSDAGAATVGHALGVTLATLLIVALMAIAGAIEGGAWL
jgi:hypothetical protein